MNWLRQILEVLRRTSCKAQLAEQEKLWLETLKEEQAENRSVLNTVFERLDKALKQIPQPLPELEIVGTITSGEVKRLALAIIATDIEIPLGEAVYVVPTNASMMARLRAHPDFYRKPTKDDPFNCDRWADAMVGVIRSANPSVAACACWLMDNMKHAYVLYIADYKFWAVTQQTTEPVFWIVWNPLEVTRLGGGF